MTDPLPRPILFLKDFTGGETDKFFWLADDQLEQVTVESIVAHPQEVIFHDFWLIRDVFIDRVGKLPQSVVDLDEFRVSISGDPNDRISRERIEITTTFEAAGIPGSICAEYRKMFYGAAVFDESVGLIIANAMVSLYVQLCDAAHANGEFERFFDVEVPVFRVLQQAMSVGLKIDTGRLSELRENAEYEYFLSLKNYSAKHGMPLETPSDASIEAWIIREGFDLDGVSIEYILEYLPHSSGFGSDTRELRELDATRRILSSLTLSMDRVRPIVDVFGSRTSRIQLRSPSLQNIPKKYRNIILPSRRKILSYVDFDQYEVGIMAALSGDAELNRLYGAGDMYALFAEEYLRVPGYRTAAKQLFLSYAYGMSRKALVDAAVELGVSRENAKAAFRHFDGYEGWKKSIVEEFARDGRIPTILGNHYKRALTGPLLAKERRSVVSQVIQGAASLIFKRVILEVGKLQDVAIVLPMHDALLFEHQEIETPAQVVEVFQRVMTAELNGRILGKASVGQFAVN